MISIQHNMFCRQFPTFFLVTSETWTLYSHILYATILNIPVPDFPVKHPDTAAINYSVQDVTCSLHLLVLFIYFSLQA